MAIFTPGPAVGQISGRVGGSVFSHNKGGMYIRNGTIPTTVQTLKALKYKRALSAYSAAYANLTVEQRQAWVEYAANHPVTNRIGRSHTLNPLNWYIKLNTRLGVAGDTPLALPPAIAGPVGAVITDVTVAVTGPVATVTLDTTPLGADYRAWIRAARVQSGAITNVRNKLTEIVITAKDVASPIDISAALIAELGTLQAGDWYHVECRVLDTTTGLMSGPSTWKEETAA